MSEVEGHSVTNLLIKLKQKDSRAADEIWNKYFTRLIPLARNKLAGLRGRNLDEEDVLVSVFDRFFRAVEENRFARLNDRNDLWQILLMLTERQVKDQYRKENAQKRQASRTLFESELGEQSIADVAKACEDELSVEFAEAFSDFIDRAIRTLRDARLREIALMRMEGFTNLEIAKKLEVSERTIERKLERVRSMWADEFQSV